MYKITESLLLYSDCGEESILTRLSLIFKELDKGGYNVDELRLEVNKILKSLLDLATKYGFNDNLWANYLAFILVTNENSFTLTAEKNGCLEGSVNTIALNDFRCFYELLHFDFSEIKDKLGINTFDIIIDYKSIPKKKTVYNENVSSKVTKLSKDLMNAKDEQEIFDIMNSFYADYGVGMFGLNKAFRIMERKNDLIFEPVINADVVTMDDLIGYDIQKEKLIKNTESFVRGLPSNNCLLYGDSGTGKSTMIKAILNQYYDQGLRMIEIYKHQFKDLGSIISQIKNRNYRFIIYMDDLSFEDFEVEYKYLKAVIEGGLESRPENVLIYATSNRRHLIKESFDDRSDMNFKNGLHHSDTMEEKLSLVARFGVAISFSSPNAKEYKNIVLELAKRHEEITLSEEEILLKANQWEIQHGGMSGRVANQFIDYLLGMN